MRVEPGREPRPGRRTEDPGFQRATFAGGCFWGLEDAFHRVPGVVSVLSGYTGGHADNPTYEQVCSGTTGHAEAIQIVFDPRRVSYDLLMKLFLCPCDSRQLNRQAPLVGIRYCSVVLYHNERQRAEAESVVAELEVSSSLPQSGITRIEPAGRFWPVDDYHRCFRVKRACHRGMQ